MRTFNIKEVIWPDGDSQKAAQTAWEKRFAEIENMRPPKGKDKALIENKKIAGISKWCKAVFYYGDPYDVEVEDIPLKGYLDILVNAGVNGVWITSYGKSTGKDFMYEKSTGLAKAYRPPAQRLGKATVFKGKDSFYLEHGAIDLPFEYKESVDISFYGHALDKDIELDIETDVVGEVEKVSLVDKLNAMIATNYAPGLNIDKIRTRKRIVAGMQGEEIVYRATEKDGNDKGLYFKWAFPGEKSNAHFPNIAIDMQALYDNLEEKIAVWDTILDSMRPAGS
jgi:hypothetical protein